MPNNKKIDFDFDLDLIVAGHPERDAVYQGPNPNPAYKHRIRYQVPTTLLRSGLGWTVGVCDDFGRIFGTNFSVVPAAWQKLPAQPPTHHEIELPDLAIDLTKPLQLEDGTRAWLAPATQNKVNLGRTDRITRIAAISPTGVADGKIVNWYDRFGEWLAGNDSLSRDLMNVPADEKAE